MGEHLTVGKLVDILNNMDIPDDSEIWFWRVKDDNKKEEVSLDEFSINYEVGDNYKKPFIYFVIGN